MRRLISLLSLLTLVAIVVGSNVSAATQPVDSADSGLVLGQDRDGRSGRQPLIEFPFESGQMIRGAYQPVLLERVSDPDTARLADAPPASDNCSDAAILEIPIGELIAGPTIVNGMTRNPLDPDIAGCMWGTPQSTSGYRTVWYKATMPTSGQLIIEAAPNADFEHDYDTVIAVHTTTGATCNTLTTIACNDDYEGFLSRVSMPVNQGDTYFIEIADHELAVNDIARLNLRAWIEDADNLWDVNSAWTMNEVRSRHAVVSEGDHIYIVGGQTVVQETIINPVETPIRTGNMMRFDTTDGTWTELTPIPSQCVFDGRGYSNTDAALVNGKIYIPSGYVGDEYIYAGEHCVYDIATNLWQPPIQEAPWPDIDAFVGPDPFGYVSIVSDPASNAYWVTGGVTGRWLYPQPDTQAHNDLFLYFADFDTWRASPLDQPAANVNRYAHTAGLLPFCPGSVPNGDPCVCVTGGIEPTTTAVPAGIVLPSTECYNRNTRTWSPVANLNISRFMHGSAVGPDGRWYVFGGFDGTLRTVPEMEVYDPFLDEWIVLDQRFNIDDPAVGWPRGAFVDDQLYVFGGETDLYTQNGMRAVPLVRRLDFELNNPLWASTEYMPVIYGIGIDGTADTLQDAVPMDVGGSATGDFNLAGDRFDFFRFDMLSNSPVTIRLNGIPEGDNYDLFVYDRFKRLIGRSENIDNRPEEIQFVLVPERYYILVVAEDNSPIVDGTYTVTIDR